MFSTRTSSSTAFAAKLLTYCTTFAMSYWLTTITPFWLSAYMDISQKVSRLWPMSATLSALPSKLFFSSSMHGIHVLFQARIILVALLQLVKNLPSLSITQQRNIGSWHLSPTAWNYTHKISRHTSLLFMMLPNYLTKNNKPTIESSSIHGDPIPALIQLATLSLLGVLSNPMPQKFWETSLPIHRTMAHHRNS